MSRMLGLFMVMPVLAIGATHFDDYSPLMLGIAIGGYGLTQAALQIPMGLLSDKFGRKPIILCGLLLFALGSVIAAQADSMMWIVIGRILQGMGAIAGAVMALAADSSRADQRTKVMAIIGISIGLSFYIAIIIGPIIAASQGLGGVFWATASMAVVAMLLVAFVVPTPAIVAASDETLPQLTQLRHLFTDRQLTRLNLSVGLLHMMITIVFVSIPTTLVNLALPLADHYLLYAPVFGAAIVLLGIIMQVAKRVKTGVGLQLGVLFMLVSFLGMGYANQTLSLMVIWLILFFAGFSFLEARLPALVSVIAPAGARGSAMGIYASFQFFGAFLGGLTSGIVISWFDTATLYAALVIICLLWLGLFLRFHHGQSQLKRVTLSLQSSRVSADSIKQALQQFQGVIEVKPMLESRVVYLKVDRVFDSQAAQTALTHLTVGE